MRCPDCNKFVSYEEADVDDTNEEISDDGNIVISCTIKNLCAECGNELTQAEIQLSDSVDVSDHKSKNCQLDISVEAERVSRSGNYDKNFKFVSSFGRYARTYYGVELSYSVRCSCDDSFEINGSITDYVQASDMEVMV